MNIVSSGGNKIVRPSAAEDDLYNVSGFAFPPVNVHPETILSDPRWAWRSDQG